MRRRDVLRWLSVPGAAAGVFGARSASAQRRDSEAALEAAPVDPYFLDPGELSDGEAAALVEVETLQERQAQGQSVVIPRGLKPARAANYRLVHWDGAIGDSNGRFVSPLSTAPTLGPLRTARTYRFNGQIFGLHAASEDWRGTNQGTLTVEVRAPLGGQQMTWFFAQQFVVDESGLADIGYQYIAQREGVPEPVVTDGTSVAIRVQLIRAPRRAAVLFRKILNTALALSGIPVSLGSRDAGAAVQSLPPLRLPAMFTEAAALVQAMIGSTAAEIPIWRGAFTLYAIAQGGSQLALRPGYWLMIDAARELDLRGVMLEDLGGQLAPTRGGQPLDANYLVLNCEIDEGAPPSYLRSFAPATPAREGAGDRPESLAVPREPTP